MRTELLYIVLVFSILSVVFSNQSDKKQAYCDTSSFQLIDINKKICVAPTIVFSLKKPFPELNYFRPIKEKLIENSFGFQIKSVLPHLFSANVPCLLSIRQRQFRFNLRCSTENEDSHLLISLLIERLYSKLLYFNSNSQPY